MKTVLLLRYETDDEGTSGILLFPDYSILHTIELPYRNNQRNISCIPAGEYIVMPYVSRKFGRVYHVMNVPNRSYILFHAGNWAGDRSKGYRTNSWGCILVGLSKGTLYGQKAVLNSRLAMATMRNKLEYKPFKLIIKEV